MFIVHWRESNPGLLMLLPHKGQENNLSKCCLFKKFTEVETCCSQRIYISGRRDNTRHRLTNIWLTQPLHACSVRWAGSAVYCRQSGERLGESNVWKTKRGAVPSITDVYSLSYTVPKVIDFPRYNTKWSGENEILRGIFQVVSRFPLHFMLYRGNLDYFLDSV